jgi:hypothetical protein
VSNTVVLPIHAKGTLVGVYGYNRAPCTLSQTLVLNFDNGRPMMTIMFPAAVTYIV